MRNWSHDRITLHWAINGLRNGRRWSRHPHPYGQEFDREYGCKVRVLVPDHAFAVASRCRVERDNWHNRIHHSMARYIASGPAGIMEYGITACSRHLVDPLYIDEPVRLCDCGNGDASMCPLCEIVVHRDKPSCVRSAA